MVNESVAMAPCEEIIKGYEYIYYDDPLSIDLLSCFSEIFCADISTKPKGKEARNLLVQIKVDPMNLLAWQECKPLIEQLVCFITNADGEKWNLAFTPHKYNFVAREHTKPLFQGNVALLSGGLDSFCGAYDVVRQKRPTLFVGYKNNPTTTSKMKSVFDFVRGRYENCELYDYKKTSINKDHPTQRTRSLLFLALAVASARKHKINEVILYENGIMTLNPSFQSRGTTKTTHPKTIMLFQQTIEKLGFSQKIRHPYLYYTKGEMVNMLDDDFRLKIKDTHSCSKSRQAKDFFRGKPGINSCGACVPCLLRKISLAAYDMEAYDHEYSIPYNGDLENADYRSSLLYFKTFANAVREQRILQELDIRPRYYDDKDYLAKTLVMLDRFAKEVDLFMQKYGG